MEKAKMSWRELCNYLVAYNEKHNIICKGPVTALNNAGDTQGGCYNRDWYELKEG